MKKILPFLFLSVVGFSPTIAQYGGSSDRACILCSIDVGVGWYMPSLGYLNDESYLSDIGGSFNGGLIFTGALEAKVYGNFMAGIQAGYWSDKATVNDAGTFIAMWDEELTLSIIPITLFGKYEFSIPSSKRFFPFVGAGFTTNFVNQDLKREVGGVLTEETLSGSASTVSTMLGLKVAIVSHVDFGLEYNYVLGGFDQTFLNEGQESIQNVGLDGSLILGKLSFTIDDRLNPRRNFRSGKRKSGRGKSYRPSSRRKSFGSKRRSQPKRRYKRAKSRG